MTQASLSKAEESAKFVDKVHLYGRLTVLVALAAFVGFPILLAVMTGTEIEWGIVITACIAILPTFTITAISQNLVYSPMIGPGALYIACVTGNLGSMKLPACVNAMELAGCEPGSEKGDVLSILAVCASTVVTTLIVFLGMLFLAPLFQPIYENPVFQPAFTNLIPAMMGALLVPYIAYSVKDSLVPILVPVALVVILGQASYASWQSFIMIGVIVLAVLASCQLYKRRLAKKKD